MRFLSRAVQKSLTVLLWRHGNEDRSKKPRRTSMVPVTTMEEVPVLTPEERSALITSLAAAEARVKAGQFIEFDPATLKKRLFDIHSKAKRAKQSRDPATLDL